MTSNNRGKGIDGIREIILRSSDTRDTNNLFEQLKELVSYIEKEMQGKQEELEVQAEELEAQNQELRENAEALQKAEEASSRLALIVESSDDAIISKSLGGIITSWNDAAERMFGYAAEEVLGKNVSLLVPPGHHDEIPGILDRIRNGERVNHFETVRMGKDGKRIDVSITVSPIKDKAGRIVGASSIKRDITVQKQMEKALQEKQEEIEVQAEELEVQNEELRANNDELQEAKMQSELYLDLMGHDISNMHQIALAQLEMAREILDADGALKADNKELIDTPLQTLARSAGLIENVRNLQKVKAGEYRPETIDLGKMLEEIVRENINVPGQNVTIHYTPAGRCLVKATPLLKDVLNNLVDNAIKHNNGSPRIDIKVDRIDKNGASACKVAIEDNGIGIPDSRKEELFHRFKRGQTQARGTGLGLYIVKTLVESFNGRVMVEDRVPNDHTKGSRFLVYLPGAEDETVD